MGESPTLPSTRKVSPFVEVPFKKKKFPFKKKMKKIFIQKKKMKKIFIQKKKIFGEKKNFFYLPQAMFPFASIAIIPIVS